MRGKGTMAEYYKARYPPGTRIRLGVMNDPYTPVEPGTLGTVDHVDDAGHYEKLYHKGQIHMKWDNGRTLALIPGHDSFSVVPQAPERKSFKLYMPLTAERYERNRYGDWEDTPEELDGADLREYADSILAAMVKNRAPEERERGLMRWYHENDAVNAKELLNNKLMNFTPQFRRQARRRKEAYPERYGD